MKKNEKNILVVDDMTSIRKFIRGTLEDYNYNVFEASNGEEGIKVFEKYGDIDLIITDIYMPIKSGLELVVDLREKHKNLKTIVLSDGGKNNFSNELGVVEALGATYFMKKDFIKDKLIGLVKDILNE
ncbi:response regulator [Clostridium saccharoperbutylacetonicum]|uniref:response regulator n=1 Tax=Clostridium saccharoperbutylacetonicum TaxID=36745 RepID=UPI00098404E3|nr:response regulator [Clostridium saccharoperbutylacetonicum]AQR92832.1 CAI-1 autoinducer sensor kinase/phosphatase CqsS [Clostridium saccharoperbutylacetonicum]